VLAGSDYVKQGLMQCGVGEQKIRVTRYIPVGTNLPYVDRRGRKGPLTVGFVGAVGLRKGAPYFFEVARRFDPAQVRFVMVGPVQMTEEGLKHKGAVELTGSVPRERVRDWLEKFDVMLLPTTCEGRVGSVLEAMETGLSAVTTLNSGVPITDGQDGFFAQPDDIDALEARVRQLLSDEDLRITMGNRARETIQECTMDAYCRELAGVLG
jgi:glycosyltransferase involved in cell wall biosynthesis